MLLAPVPTLRAYAARYLALQAPHLAPRTRLNYAWIVDKYLAPTLGDIPLDALTPADVHEWLAHMFDRRLGIRTVHKAYVQLRACLQHAVEAELLARNPAPSRVRALRMPPTMDRDVLSATQLPLFLETAQAIAPRAYPALLTCAWAGLRISEARALLPGDVDFHRRTIRVSRAISAQNDLGPPKNRKTRVIDMTRTLERRLRPLCTRPGWIVRGATEHPFSYYEIRRGLRRTLKLCALPSHLTVHSLRHGYASILVSRGVSLEYVRRQLGHASIRLTADLYGRHLPFPRPRLLDRL